MLLRQTTSGINVLAHKTSQDISLHKRYNYIKLRVVTLRWEDCSLLISQTSYRAFARNIEDLFVSYGGSGSYCFVLSAFHCAELILTTLVQNFKTICIHADNLQEWSLFNLHIYNKVNELKCRCMYAVCSAFVLHKHVTFNTQEEK